MEMARDGEGESREADNAVWEGVGMALHGLFRWLLGELCKKAGIDSQEIDNSLTYDENPAELRRKFPGADLDLPKDWSRKRNERRAFGISDYDQNVQA